MKFSMTGQEKGDLLIQVTAWAGLTNIIFQINHTLYKKNQGQNVTQYIKCSIYSMFKTLQVLNFFQGMAVVAVIIW